MSSQNEIIIDGKLMNIGKRGPEDWADTEQGMFQINYGAELDSSDPGNISSSAGQNYFSIQNQHHKDTGPAAGGVDIERRGSDSSSCLGSMDKHPEESDELESKSLKLKQFVKIVLIIMLVAAYNAYIGFALHYHITSGRDIDWCGGLGFLMIITVIVYVFLLYFHIIKKILPWRKLNALIPRRLVKFVSSTPGKWLLSITVLVSISIFLIIDTKHDRQRLVSAAGILAIILFGFIFSTNRKQIVWRHVVWGLSLQFIFGLLILRWNYGKMFFDCIGDKVLTRIENCFCIKYFCLG